MSRKTLPINCSSRNVLGVMMLTFLSGARRYCWFACLALVCCGAAHAVEGDDDFLRARQAQAAGNSALFEKSAARVPPTYPLFPYLVYWRLLTGGNIANDDRVTDFLATYPDTWLAERVRGEWLKQLGRREVWPAYLAEFPRLVRPDSTHLCYARRAELAANDRSHLKEAIALWFSSRDPPIACNPLFAQLMGEGLINREDVWRRLRLALEVGNVSVALTAALSLPSEDRPSLFVLEQATRTPASLLQSSELQLTRRQDQEVALYALAQLAKINSLQAEAALQKRLPLLPEADQRYAWGELAGYAARRHEANALTWFGQAGTLMLSDTSREWWVRAALRAGQWATVGSVIDSMTDANRDLSVWRYWRGRAYKAMGKPALATQWFTPLSREPNYYGQLALEELGAVASNPVINVKTGGDELDAVARNPAIQRGMALFRLGLRTEAVNEWNWATRTFNDRQLLAAAELARRAEWYDQAINTAEKTRETHDFELRFIAPYREIASAAAAENKLDEAWIYGLIRQESRFINVARSGVGASGLMQIMPETARWIARKLGIKGFEPRDMHSPDTNIKFGTYYLKHVQNQLDGSPVLATAAYNAGPGRAQRWRTAGPMEAAIYIETIPFTETRDYVRKVMSNAMYYAARFGQPSTLLKDRLGVIPARSGAVSPMPDPTPPPSETPDS